MNYEERTSMTYFIHTHTNTQFILLRVAMPHFTADDGVRLRYEIHPGGPKHVWGHQVTSHRTHSISPTHSLSSPLDASLSLSLFLSKIMFIMGFASGLEAWTQQVHARFSVVSPENGSREPHDSTPLTAHLSSPSSPRWTTFSTVATPSRLFCSTTVARDTRKHRHCCSRPSGWHTTPFSCWSTSSGTPTRTSWACPWVA